LDKIITISPVKTVSLWEYIWAYVVQQKGCNKISCESKLLE